MYFETYFLYSAIGYCATMPSVEFYRYLGKILTNFVPPVKDPQDSPVAGNPDPEPDYIWTVASGLAGGLAGGFLGSLVFKENPAYVLGAAFAGGRILSDVTALVRRVKSK